jgi:hypothetical protein
MEALDFSETLTAVCQITMHHIPEDRNLHNQCLTYFVIFMRTLQNDAVLCVIAIIVVPFHDESLVFYLMEFKQANVESFP